MSLSRVLFAVLLVINLAALGFTFGAMVSAKFLTSEEGLAGGALVAVYGLGGALAGILAGVVLVRKLTDDTLLRVALGAIVLSGVSIGLILLRVNK